MKLLLDEHFSPEIARQLRRRRHDVIAARAQPELHGLSDAELLASANREHRAVVTEDVADFAELHRAAIITGRRHYGLIFTSSRQFPRTTRAIGRLVRALDALLDANRTDAALESQSWWLEPFVSNQPATLRPGGRSRRGGRPGSRPRPDRGADQRRASSE